MELVMTRYLIVVSCGILILTIVLLYFLRDRGAPPSTVEVTSSTDISLQNTDAGVLISEYLRIAFSGEGETGTSNQIILERMREDPAAVAEEINRVYRSVSRQAYNARWVLIYCLTKLEHPSTLTFLSGVVQDPIPSEESQNIHLFSSVAEETTIRMRAIEGIRILAANGNGEARDALFSCLELSSLSLRIAATQALLSLPDIDSNRSRLLNVLPANEHFFLNLRPARTEDFLIEFNQGSEQSFHLSRMAMNPPPPLENDDQPIVNSPSTSRSSTKRPPRIP